jgi:hypothetical protein
MATEDVRIAMTPTRLSAVCALASLLLSAPAQAQAPLTSTDARALQVWTLGLEEYLAIREEAARTVPLPPGAPDLRQLLQARSALAAAIRTRRVEAKIGDLFTFQVRRTFRKLIALGLVDHGIVLADLLAELRTQVGPGSFRIAVNDSYPRQLAAFPACLLEVLPPLPWGLDYRIIDHDLILIDLGSGLVIDVLPDALPRGVGGTDA